MLVISRLFGRQWVPIGVFGIYTALNMLDRQLLAAVAAALREDFHLSHAQYGQLALQAGVAGRSENRVC